MFRPASTMIPASGMQPTVMPGKYTPGKYTPASVRNSFAATEAAMRAGGYDMNPATRTGGSVGMVSPAVQPGGVQNFMPAAQPGANATQKQRNQFMGITPGANATQAQREAFMTHAPGGINYGANAGSTYGVPPTGLIGSEMALQGGLRGALGQLGGHYTGGGVSSAGLMAAGRQGFDKINQNRDMAIGQINQGVSGLSGYNGQAAHDQQQALSGALGPEAQQQAYAAFQSSPGQQWLQQQAERGLLRNSAAIGGLGGGNVRQELQNQAMGMAQQDFQNNFNRLGGIADRGLTADQAIGNLRAQGANAYSQAGGQSAGLQGQLLGAGASVLGANAGIGAANIRANTALQQDAAKYAYMSGQDLASGRTNAGNAIAGGIANTTSALSNLANEQGMGLANLYGQNTGNLANILAGAGTSQGQGYQDLATLLANIGANAGSQYAAHGLPGATSNPGQLGGIGNFMGGMGSFMDVMGMGAG